MRYIVAAAFLLTVLLTSPAKAADSFPEGVMVLPFRDAPRQDSVASDPAAVALLTQVAQSMKAIQQAKCDIEVTVSASDPGSPNHMEGRLALMRPNFLSVEMWDISKSSRNAWTEDAPHYILMSDGTTLWDIEALNTVHKSSADQNGHLSNGDVFGFLDKIATVYRPHTSDTVALAGTANWLNGQYRLLHITNTTLDLGTESPADITLYVGADNLIHRGIIKSEASTTFDVKLTNLNTTPGLTKADFAFTVPEYVKKWPATQAESSSSPPPTVGKQPAPAMGRGVAPPPSVGPKMDARTREIVDRVNRAIAAIPAITAEYTHTIASYRSDGSEIGAIGHIVGTITATHTGFFKDDSHFLIKDKKTKTIVPFLRELWVYGGQFEWIYNVHDKTYMKRPVASWEDLRPGFAGDIFEPYFEAKPQLFRTSKYVRYSGQQTWAGNTYTTITAYHINFDSSGEALILTTTAFIGRDNLVYRMAMTARFVGGPYAGQTLVEVSAITRLHRLGPLPQSAFAFELPAGAQPEQDEESGQQTPPLANGVHAPNFTVYDPTGKPVKLSDYKGKVVVIDFWATWCGPCQMSLPGTNAAASGYAGKDVAFLAINVWDTKPAFAAWLPKHKSLRALNFLIDTTPGSGKDVASNLYKVSGIPTQFVIGKDGKIDASFVGYDQSTKPLRDAVDAALAAK